MVKWATIPFSTTVTPIRGRVVLRPYEGHHINNVKDHVELARNPENIKFVKGRTEHLEEHGGNFKNETSGELIKRRDGG